MPQTAFSTLSCPDWSFQELIDYGSRFGYDGVEIRLIQRETDLLRHPALKPSELPTRRKELADAGFTVCGLASSVRFDHPDAAQRNEDLETGKAYLELARELGAGFVRVFGDALPGGSDDTQRSELIEQVAEGLQRLGEFAEQVGPDVLIETHGDFADSRLMEATMSRVESPAVGVLWDTHHPWRFFGEPLDETFARLKPWVRHTHWKDSISQARVAGGGEADQAAQAAHELMSGHRHADYVLFRGGEFPAVECMRLLRRDGYAGWHCLEWEKMWHPEIEDPEIALPLFPTKIRELWDAAEC